MPPGPHAGHLHDGPTLPSPSRQRRGNSLNVGPPDAAAKCVICGTCGGTAPTRPSPTPVSPCPLCGHGSCSQTHILCTSPGIAEERASLHHDLTLLAGRTGPRRTLVRAYQRLLFHEPGVANRGQLWTGLWSPQHRTALGPTLQLCSLKDGQRTPSGRQLGHSRGPTALEALQGTPRSTGASPLPACLPGAHLAHGLSPLSPASTSGRTPVSPIPQSRRGAPILFTCAPLPVVISYPSAAANTRAEIRQ